MEDEIFDPATSSLGGTWRAVTNFRCRVDPIKTEYWKTVGRQFETKGTVSSYFRRRRMGNGRRVRRFWGIREPVAGGCSLKSTRRSEGKSDGDKTNSRMGRSK